MTHEGRVPFSDPQLRIALEHPSDWRVERPAPQKVVFVAPDASAWVTISLLSIDCEAAQPEIMTPRVPNVYSTEGKRRSVGGQEATQAQVVDSIAMTRKTVLFVGRDGGCLTLEYGARMGHTAARAEQELNTIISTVKLLD